MLDLSVYDLIGHLTLIIILAVSTYYISSLLTDDNNNHNTSDDSWRITFDKLHNPDKIQQIEPSEKTKEIPEIHIFLQESNATQMLNLSTETMEYLNKNNNPLEPEYNIYLFEVNVDASTQVYKNQSCPHCNNEFTLTPHRLTNIKIGHSGHPIDGQIPGYVRYVKTEETIPPCMECYASLVFEREDIEIEEYDTLAVAGL